MQTQLLLGKVAISLFAPALILAYSGKQGWGPPAGYSGAPGEQTCAACHTGSSGRSGVLQVSFENGAAAFTPGQIQTLRLTIADASAKLFGFQVTARFPDDNSQAGYLEPQLQQTNPNIVICEDSASRPNASSCPVGKEFAENRPAQPTGDLHFRWQAPTSGATRPVVFYASAVAADGDGTPAGDHVYTAAFTFPSPISGPPRIAGLVPSSAGGFGFVYGNSLAAGEAVWNYFIGNDGKLPTTLAGVTVTIGGKPAPLSYVGPNQINFIMPDLPVPPGTFVDAVVTTPSGTASIPIPTSVTSANFFTSVPGNWVAAQVPASGTAIAPVAAFSGRESRPARPGEVIELYGTGFGPTVDPLPYDRLITAPSRLASQLELHFMSGLDTVAKVTPEWAGRVAPGLDQVNVRIPDSLPDGTYGIRIYFPPPLDVLEPWNSFCPIIGPCTGPPGPFIAVASE